MSTVDFAVIFVPTLKKCIFSVIEDSENVSHIQDLKFKSILPDFIHTAAKSLGFHITDRVIDCEKGQLIYISTKTDLIYIYFRF